MCKKISVSLFLMIHLSLFVLSIKVDFHGYCGISPLIFPHVFAVSLSIGFCFLETKR